MTRGLNAINSACLIRSLWGPHPHAKSERVRNTYKLFLTWVGNFSLDVGQDTLIFTVSLHLAAHLDVPIILAILEHDSSS